MKAFAIESDIGWPAGLSGGGGQMQVCLKTLLRGDNKGNIYPWLAESYKVADDMKSMIFNLRKGVKFHDGSRNVSIKCRVNKNQVKN